MEQPVASARRTARGGGSAAGDPVSASACRPSWARPPPRQSTGRPLAGGSKHELFFLTMQGKTNREFVADFLRDAEVENCNKQTAEIAHVGMSESAELISAYDFVRRHYTDSESAVQGWRNSKSNLSQGPLNRRMLQMLELLPGMTIADLGSGCGITAIAFSVFGCASVLGFEIHEYSCEVAREMAETIRLAAAAEGWGQVTMPTFISAAVNERLRGGSEMMFDRLHGGYMMSQENASRYVREHLNPNGIAVMNVGSGNNGAVTIFRKDAAGIVSSQEPGINVVFQEDLHPSFTPAALPAPAGQHKHTNTQTHTHAHTHTHTHT